MFNSKFKYIELHSHLDGSIKAETIAKICGRRQIDVPHGNATALQSFLKIDEPCSLRTFLHKFDTVLKIVQGDKEGIAEVCSDFIKAAAESQVCYIEARFCPEILSSPALSTDSVVETVLSTFESAGKRYNVLAKAILSSLRQLDLANPTNLDLAMKYKPHGVVGIDLAGDEQYSEENHGTKPQIIEMFKDAKKHGIHRTVHAGENGSIMIVKEAVEQLYAERIGHGYHILDDRSYYEILKTKNIHFEVCPTSSFLTGAVHKDPSLHPIHTFSKDQINYSISCDDTMITGRNLAEEYEFCKKSLNISDKEIMRTNFNAARASFLEENDKQELLNHLKTQFKTIN